MGTVMGISKFDHFFRRAAGLDVDKADLKRYSDFVNHKINRHPRASHQAAASS